MDVSRQTVDASLRRDVNPIGDVSRASKYGNAYRSFAKQPMKHGPIA
jgi:intergrase/recombinase